MPRLASVRERPTQPSSPEVFTGNPNPDTSNRTFPSSSLRVCLGSALGRVDSNAIAGRCIRLLKPNRLGNIALTLPYVCLPLSHKAPWRWSVRLGSPRVHPMSPVFAAFSRTPSAELPLSGGGSAKSFDA